MKLQELVYDVIQSTRDFSDNSFVQESYVEHMINTYRAKYLHQAYSNKPVLEPINRQSLALELELVNSSSAPGLIKTKRRILRTVEKIPKILQLGRKPGIHSIASIDRIELGEFELVDKRRAQYNVHSPFCGMMAYLDTDYRLYFVTNSEAQKFLKYITLDAVFEDPREAIYFEYQDELDSELSLDLVEYPIDMGLWSNIKSEITSEILRQLGTPLDLQNSTASPAAAIDPKNSDITRGNALGGSVNPRQI